MLKNDGCQVTEATISSFDLRISETRGERRDGSRVIVARNTPIDAWERSEIGGMMSN